MIENFHYPDGHPMPLSNFYPSPITDEAGWTYPTVEHYFQTMKTLDPSGRDEVRSCSTPGLAKKAGRRITLRSDWEAVKLGVMRRALELKFPKREPGELPPPNYELSTWLLNTGDHLLVEGNTWGDRVWGQVDGVGSNWLGALLMLRRVELRAT